MYPVHDADALLMLALAFAGKRKPAAIEEVAIALGMLQPRLPAEARLLDAFERLGSHGLIVVSDEGHALSVEGQKLVHGISAKDGIDERIAHVRERLAASNAVARHTPVRPDANALSAAILAWRASLPPPTKSEKVAQQREARLQEENAKRIAEGKAPRPARPPGPKKRPYTPRGAKGVPRGGRSD